jgi:hypothetical protein
VRPEDGVRYTSRIGIAIAASLALVTNAGAQAQVDSARGPEVGSRVRVFAPELRIDRYVGRVQTLDGSVMVLDTGEVRTVLGMESGPVLVDQYRLVTIRLSTIEALEVSGGRTVRSTMWKGAIVGALVGGLLFGLGAMPEINPGAQDFIKGVPPGLLFGAIGGALIGWGIGGERWLPASIPGPIRR